MRVVLRAPRVAALVPAASGQGLVVSAVLHVALFGGAILAASVGGKPPQVPAVYVVEMIQDPGPSSGAPTPAMPPAAEPEPAPERSREPEPDPVPEVPAEKPPPRKKPPEKPAEKAAPKRPEPPTPEPAQPAATARAEPRPEPGSGGGGAGLATGAPGSGSGVATVDSQVFPFAYYQRVLQARVTAAWARPVVPGGLLSPIGTKVSFQVLRTGLITEIVMVSDSGYPPLDRSALRAVQDANPLPPLPEEFDGESINVNFYFELTPGG